MKFIAIDGSVCETEEEMERINEEVGKWLRHDEMAKAFGFFQGVEKSDWVERNIFKRGLR